MIQSSVLPAPPHNPSGGVSRGWGAASPAAGCHAAPARLPRGDLAVAGQRRGPRWLWGVIHEHRHAGNVVNTCAGSSQRQKVLRRLAPHLRLCARQVAPAPPLLELRRDQCWWVGWWVVRVDNAYYYWC